MALMHAVVERRRPIECKTDDSRAENERIDRLRDPVATRDADHRSIYGSGLATDVVTSLLH
jgi:hypothetical protein